jgi:hypothetical protein
MFNKIFKNNNNCFVKMIELIKKNHSFVIFVKILNIFWIKHISLESNTIYLFRIKL